MKQIGKKAIIIIIIQFLLSAFCGAALMAADGSHTIHIVGCISLVYNLILLGSLFIVIALKYGED